MANQDESKKLKYVILLFVGILLTVALFLAFLNLAFSAGTYKEWTKGNICAHGTIKFAGFGIRYFDVTIGAKEIPIGKDNIFSIEFEDGQKLSSDKITLSAISKLNPKIIDQNELDGSTTRYYKINEALFSFSGDLLVLFEIARTTTKENTVLKIGDGEMKNFFSLPLTEQQCELLFGKPDKVQTFYSL